MKRGKERERERERETEREGDTRRGVQVGGGLCARARESCERWEL